MIDRLKYTMQALQMLERSQEVTANNLANINTPGYRSQKLFYRALQSAVDGQSVDVPKPFETTSSAAGQLQQTGNPFDLAVTGKGFFQINKDGRLVLSRNGRFHVDSDGFLRDNAGGYVQGRNGSIYIPELKSGAPGAAGAKVDIARDGRITVDGASVGQLQLASVPSYDDLQRLDNNYMAPKETAQLQPDTQSGISQGYYESANVNPLKEMISMTTNMRLFETQQRVMRTTDEILGRISSTLGKF